MNTFGWFRAALGIAISVIAAGSAHGMRLYLTGTEQAACVAVSPVDSSVYVVGKNDLSAITSEMLLVKYDSTGAFLGEQRFPYGGRCEGVDVIVDPKGQVIVLANGESGTSPSDVILLEYSSTLTLVSSSTYSYSSSSVDKGVKLVRHPFGIIYVIGETDTGTGSADVLVLSYGIARTLTWSTVWSPSTGDDRVTCASVNKWGLYVGGESNAGGGTSSGFLARFNPLSGVFIFNRVVTGAALQPTWVADVSATASGHVYYVATQGVAAGDNHVRVVRTRQTLLGTIWTQVFARGAYEDIGNKIAVADSYVIVGASSFLPPPIAYDAVCLTFDRTTGTLLGTATYHNVDSDFVYDLHADGFGNAYMTGISDGLPSHEYLVWKANLSTTLWTWRYSGPSHAEPFCLKYDASGTGSVVVTGRVAYSTFGGWLFGTEKLDAITGLPMW
ncbi:MAG: hypothetical protein IT207_02635 [Fimbriimonadaceae bacterium]|nr:hypothetical protein [Fimbriimonadaceae bacterium]